MLGPSATSMGLALLVLVCLDDQLLEEALVWTPGSVVHGLSRSVKDLLDLHRRVLVLVAPRIQVPKEVAPANTRDSRSKLRARLSVH
mmetsp:Transcript_22092/g.34633  ORF Transcript_22092/g.34633 Transcript_22092/m.34633 type:complete len:87 (+) Transcript_22092:1237-1497(+)